MRFIAPLLVCAIVATAQSRAAREPVSSRVGDAAKGAWIHGQVLNDTTSQPLARAWVTLKPLTGSTNGVAVETDEHGRFIMNRIGPGTYALQAERDGFLPSTSIRRGALRYPPMVEIKDNTHIRDLAFRLRPWSVVSGKIRYDDGEPVVGASVQFYRETVVSGRHSMQLAATARANDRGEYRVHTLTPGAYFIAAFRNRTVAPAFEEQERVDDTGKPLSEWRYATTFYPSAQKLEDAVALTVESARELDNIDIDLKPVPAVRIQGRVINGVDGKLATPPPLEFRRLSADGRSSIAVPVEAKATLDGFEIQGVTAGPYLVIAKSQFENQRIVTSRYLTVTDAPIDNLDLTMEPERDLAGAIHFEEAPNVRLAGLRVTLEPRGDLNPAATAQVRADGTFRLKVTAGEVYDVYVANMPAAAYVKSVRIGNVDLGADGVPGSAASLTVPVEVTLSIRSGTVYGRALMADGSMAGGVAIAAVPDPILGRYTAYGFTHADEYGAFVFTGLPPGRYTLFSYYDEPPCNLYDESTLTNCRARGTAVVAGEAAQTTIEIRTQPGG